MSYDLEYQSEPVCPYCGNRERDAWEIDFGGMEGDTETDCGSCGRAYRVSRHVTIYYTTHPLPDDKEAPDAP